MELCYLSRKLFYGYTQISREHFLDAINGKNSTSRWDFVKKNIGNLGGELFLITSFCPSEEFKEYLEVNTFIGTDKSSNKASYMTEVRNNPGGLYAHISYSGNWREYSELVKEMYREALPKMKLKRRNAEDIERVKYYKHEPEKDIIIYDCYIPVSY